MPHYPVEIEYSEKYADAVFEYRHVILPEDVARKVVQLTAGRRLLGEHEWRQLGVQQSIGWIHYMIHPPEQHILLFRRPHNIVPSAGGTQPSSN